MFLTDLYLHICPILTPKNMIPSKLLTDRKNSLKSVLQMDTILTFGESITFTKPNKTQAKIKSLCFVAKKSYYVLPDISISRSIHSLAMAIQCEHASNLCCSSGCFCKHQIHPSSENTAAVSLQVLRPKMSGHQGRRARCVRAHLENRRCTLNILYKCM